MAITLDTRCVQHGLSGTDKTFQTLIDTCASPPPTPEKLSSWTDDYDGEACEIKYCSVILTLNASGIPVSCRDYYVSSVRINATTPDYQELSVGPENLRASMINTSLTKLSMELDRIPEGSMVSIMFGAGNYLDGTNYKVASKVQLQDPLTGSTALSLFTITEDKTYWVTLIGDSDLGGGGGLLPIV